MLRRVVCVLCLAVCVTVMVGQANPSESRADGASVGTGFLSQEKPREAPMDEVSTNPPCHQSALFVPYVGVAGFLANPLLITGEPAVLLLHVEDVTHHHWQQFGQARLAPFSFSRSLPLQI